MSPEGQLAQWLLDVQAMLVRWRELERELHPRLAASVGAVRCALVDALHEHFPGLLEVWVDGPSS